METQTIGLFEAKTHLSELVARAERGGEVIITRHNKPVARIVPISAPQAVDVRARLQAVAAMQKIAAKARDKYGPISVDDLVGWVRKGREERTEQYAKAAKRRK